MLAKGKRKTRDRSNQTEYKSGKGVSFGSSFGLKYMWNHPFNLTSGKELCKIQICTELNCTGLQEKQDLYSLNQLLLKCKCLEMHNVNYPKSFFCSLMLNTTSENFNLPFHKTKYLIYNNCSVLFRNREVHCRFDWQNHLDINSHTHSDCVADLCTKSWQLSMTIKNRDFQLAWKCTYLSYPPNTFWFYLCSAALKEEMGQYEIIHIRV